MSSSEGKGVLLFEGGSGATFVCFGYRVVEDSNYWSIWWPKLADSVNSTNTCPDPEDDGFMNFRTLKGFMVPGEFYE